MTADQPAEPLPRRPRPPVVPRAGARGAGLLGGRRHVPGLRRAAARPGENGSNEFVFYDGPPFANGLPHYGHLLTGYVKDVVPRYQTMRGRHVERRFGWDTHGLPAEVEAEHQLGIKDKSEIDEMGVAAFNDACRTLGAALHRRVARLRHPAGPLGRLRQRLQDARPGLHGERHVGVQDPVGQGSGLLRASGCSGTAGTTGRRCRPPRPRWTTSTCDRQDPAVTVGLRLHAAGLRPGRCAGADLDHHAVDAAVQPGHGGATRTSSTRWSQAQRRALPAGRGPGRRTTPASWARSPRCCARCRGAELVGLSYTPPFDFFAGWENAHRVLAADYVTTDEGTGIVHIAPGVR